MTQSTSHRMPSPLFFLITGLFCLYVLSGLNQLPFHPDESTVLFMSADFETFWSHPLSLAWTPGQVIGERMRYRMLDAPLSRHIIGLGRVIAGAPPVNTDWQWGESWESNVSAGALPGSSALTAGRLAVTLLLPFSLLFIYLTGRQMGGEAAGLLAVLLLGTNALVLLHARRAMAEGPLLFGITFALWTYMSSDRRAWLAGLATALAFNAKHSAAALLPVMLLAIAWMPLNTWRAEGWNRGGLPAAGRKISIGWLQALGIFIAVTLLLNPFSWRDPIASLSKAVELRQKLSKAQVADSLIYAPGKVADTYGERTAALLVNMFMAPPSFSEYGNYVTETASAERAYWADLGHRLMRGVMGGSVMMAFVLLGIVLSVIHFPRAEASRQQALGILWFATLSLAAFQVLLIPLTWQRYIIPLVPLGCLWAAYGLALPILALSKNIKKPNLTPETLD